MAVLPKSEEVKVAKSQQKRTKQELLEQRKEMMKSKVKAKVDNFVVADQSDISQSVPMELMHRLAQGVKSQVDVKSMKKLTSKNYSNLPEIKRKKEEESKKMEMKNRMAIAK